ncbi:hypothetical protein [Vibrio cyclitrophicus]|uniref:hypothetical protein n=1 Tax=Vibrio cyclitrophicus TaxID=47951 RepID=UPI000C819426|nr:hypothetical protein [Vibrio cyclitrophicus]PMH75149.1 hypothetical protein BCU59_18125 [Vibrio cyclitrophicus]
MNNIEQFSLYSAKIFELLYSSFPVPVGIDRNAMIEKFLCFDKFDELKELQNNRSRGELVKLLSTATPEIEEKVEQISEAAYELEDEQRRDRANQLDIYDGTIDFLVAEELVIFIPNQGYRLTAKAFSHLNKTFEETGIRENDSSYITAIKKLFSNTGSMSREVAVGTAITLIPKLLGYS